MHRVYIATVSYWLYGGLDDINRLSYKQTLLNYILLPDSSRLILSIDIPVPIILFSYVAAI